MAKMYPFWKLKAIPLTERILNGGFEDGNIGWEYSISAVMTDYIHSGVKSWQIFYEYRLRQSFNTVLISNIYSFTAWLRKLEGLENTMYIGVLTDAGGLFTCIDGDVPIDGQWHEINILALVLSELPTATNVQNIVFQHGTGNIGNWRVDDVSLISSG